MENPNRLELHIPSVLGFEKIAMDFAGSVARTVGLPEHRIEDLRTAVAEACLNAIEHGNKLDAAMKVGISLTLEDSTLAVAVHDEGPGIMESPPPTIEAKVKGDEKPRGWGIFLIKSLMDEVQFKSAPGGGNVVNMVIHLQK